MKKVALILALVLLVGCAARINEMMASWQGRHYSDVIASWGPPQQVIDDGQGGRIFVWGFQRSYTSPGHAQTTYDYFGDATTIYNPPVTNAWQAYRMFWVDRNGIIYRWAWRGF